MKWIFLVLYLIVLAAFAWISFMVVYHWRRWGKGDRVLVITEKVYFLVSVVILVLSLVSLIGLLIIL